MLPIDRSRMAVPAALVVLLTVWLAGAAAATQVRVIDGVTYATVDGRALKLDLHMPADVVDPPLLVWVHGGAWREGDRTSVRTEFVRSGFATASLDYRLSPEARFPAMVHDIKAAVRFLRARAADYGYRTDRIAIAGDSAGAHLAALVGTSNGVEALEGSVGDFPGQSSDIQAIISYYPATNLRTILAQSTPFGLEVRVPALGLLLGGQPDEVPDLADLASVVTHVDASDPPLLIFHGDQDPQMPINQSHELEGAYSALNLDVAMVVVHGAAHGGNVFYRDGHLERALSFLRRTIGS